MNAKKVLVLFDLNQRTAIDHDFKEEFKQEAFETESDVSRALKKLGHEPRPLALFDTFAPLIEILEKDRPDVIFNLSEAYRTDRAHEPHLVGMLELLDIPYTGADPTALMLCKDKALAKKILTFHRIKTPSFTVSSRARPFKRLRHLKFPVFVKPLATEGSEGIAQAALCEDEKSAVERVKFLHDSLSTDVMVEEYIEGREIYASVIGNDRLQVLPLIELFVENKPLGHEDAADGAPRFFTYKAKWDAAYRKKWGIRSGPPKDLDEGIARKIAETARRVCHSLRIRGYGRVDLRLTAAGEIYVIEANPNPGLASSDEFAKAAARADIGYDSLVSRILQFAESD